MKALCYSLSAVQSRRDRTRVRSASLGYRWARMGVLAPHPQRLAVMANKIRGREGEREGGERRKEGRKRGRKGRNEGGGGGGEGSHTS